MRTDGEGRVKLRTGPTGRPIWCIVLSITFNPPKKSVRSEVLLFPFSDEETEVKLPCPIFQTSKWWNWDMNSI